MTTAATAERTHPRADVDDLECFCADVLRTVGADAASAWSAAAAMGHGSRLGIGSHAGTARCSLRPQRRWTGLHGFRTAAGAEVPAPGDREWREADERARSGAPADPEPWSTFAALLERLRVRAVTARASMVAAD